jgi:amino acid adenylation domain-containing protein
MSDPSAYPTLPPEQQAIRAKCFHPTGTFVESKEEETNQSIPERFEKIVRLYPDRLAVKAGHRALTYEKLNGAANRVARVILEKRGRGSEPVALLFEHDIDVITAILGVLKAGKFYVALDPSYPLERLINTAHDSQAGLIVTNKRNVGVARRLTNDSVALLNSDEIDGAYSPDNLGLSVSSDDLAMITYTSGSTGEPKGAVREHGRFLRRLLAMTDDIALRNEERSSLLHPVSLGAGNDDVFRSLLSGGSLFLFDLRTLGVHRLAKWLEDEEITACHLSHAVFRQLVDSLSVGKEKLTKLRLIRLSGAPVNRMDFDLYRKAFLPRTSLMITLGTTEIGRICAAVVDHMFSFPKLGTPAGYPCPGIEVFLLDDRGQAVAPNQVGEIAVKGRHLHSGYWRRPELNDAKFLPGPSGGDERIYLTGDLGTMLPDNFLIHLGRKDSMVKIRGYRVEVGETERALLSHPQVINAAVAAWDRELGEKYLTAYVVPRQVSPPTIVSLHEYLGEKLPEYMIPSKFIFLETLPVAASGKIDRLALPDPGTSRPELDIPFVAPRTPVETELAQIWAKVLSVEQVGIHDRFFDLGGHSLNATQVVSQVIKRFQTEVPLQSLFESPTVAEMAAVITEHQSRKIAKSELERILVELESISEEKASQILADATATNSTRQPDE